MKKISKEEISLLSDLVKEIDDAKDEVNAFLRTGESICKHESDNAQALQSIMNRVEGIREALASSPVGSQSTNNPSLSIIICSQNTTVH